jgi:hypothetical protein
MLLADTAVNSTLSGAVQPVARARWRRCFAFSLAFRLLARIALLDLAVFIAQGLRHR